jgi:hypothetical protein
MNRKTNSSLIDSKLAIREDTKCTPVLQVKYLLLRRVQWYRDNVVADLEGTQLTPPPFTRNLPSNSSKTEDFRPKIP